MNHLHLVAVGIKQPYVLWDEIFISKNFTEMTSIQNTSELLVSKIWTKIILLISEYFCISCHAGDQIVFLWLKISSFSNHQLIFEKLYQSNKQKGIFVLGTYFLIFFHKKIQDCQGKRVLNLKQRILLKINLFFIFLS